MAWSPDGQHLAVAYRNNEVWLYNLALEPIAPFPLESDQNAYELAWSPDSNFLAASTSGRGLDNLVYIWDVSSQTTQTIIRQNQPVPANLAWNPDSTQLVATEIEHIKIWDAMTGNLEATLSSREESGSVLAVAWHPNGRLLASGSDDYVVRIWDITTVEMVKEIAVSVPEPHWIYTVEWSPDGDRLAASSWHTIYVWRATDCELITTLTEHTDTIRLLEWRGNTLAASSSVDNMLTIWDTETWQLLKTIVLDPDTSKTLSLSPDGHQIAYVDPANGLTVIELPLSTTPTTIQPVGRQLARWHPVEDVIALSNGVDVNLYDPNFELIQHVTLDSPIDAPRPGHFQLEWSPDGTQLAIARTLQSSESMSSVIELLSADDLHVTGEIVGQDFILGTPIAWSPDSTELAVVHWSNYGVEEVYVFNVTSTNLVAEFGPAPPVNIEQLAWSSDGSQVVLGDGHELQVWDRATGQFVRALPGASLNAQPAFSPTENHLAFSNQAAQNDVQIWNTDTGQLIQTLQGHSDDIYSIAWGQDRILTVSGDGTGRLWNPVTGMAEAMFLTPLVFSASWNPDGTLFVVTDNERGAYIRDATTGDIVALRGDDSVPAAFQGSPIYSGFYPFGVAWAADGQTLAFHVGGTRMPLMEEPDESWLRYDLASGNLTRQTRWPLLPALSAAERQRFRPLVDAEGSAAFLYESPDQRFLAYVTATDSGGRQLAVANRVSGQRCVLDQIVALPFTGPDDFNVIWSADSRAFVVLTQPVYGIGPVIHYVTQVDQTCTAIASTPLDFLEVAGREVVALNVYAIAPDGQSVLLRVQETDSHPTAIHLLVWRAADPAAGEIVAAVDGADVRGAGFSGEAGDTLLYVDAAGLHRHDLISGETALLEPVLQADRAIFAPTGAAVVLIQGNVATTSEVFVIDLAVSNEPQAQSGVANSRIAFASNVDGDYEIYTIEVDGSDLRQITHNEVDDTAPAWSPDGNRIAFMADRSGFNEIYVINADGTGETALTPGETGEYPDWSPDGSQIAFTSGRTHGLNDVFVMNADGTNPVNLTDSPQSFDERPRWSPDGTQIIFQTTREQETLSNNPVFDYYVIDADGSHPAKLIDGGYDLSAAAWSAVRDQIAFSMDLSRNRILLMHADGANAHMIPVLEDVIGLYPDWSPNGRQIVFTLITDHSAELAVLDLETGRIQQLTHLAARSLFARWQPAP